MFEVGKLEIREQENNIIVEGCAAPYNSLSLNMGRFVEKFGTRSLSPADAGVVALYQHDTKQVLGKTKNKSLELEFREDGLFFKLTLPNTTLGRDVAELVKRQDITGVSPGFIVEDDSWLRDEKSNIVTRTITKAKVFEISLTPFPAYPATAVALREAVYEQFVKDHEVKPVTHALPAASEIESLTKYVS